MMFGTRERFEYLECGACGTIQITEIPDLARHYPKDYYSLGDAAASDLWFTKKFKSRLAARFAGDYFVRGWNPVGKLLAEKKDWIDYFYPSSLKERLLNLNFRSRILDFGCGAGRLLQILRHFGFKRLTGADAFIERDIFYPNGVKIYKKSLAELKPAFDLIMLHHSFEHLPDPLETLLEIRRLLAQDAVCLIRIPVAASAWEQYGVNWVQLDPPRHLFSYTEKSFRLLAEKAGFSVAKIVYDSDAFQFWGSEQYLQNIPLNSEESFHGDFEKSIFTKEQIESWEEQAAELNKQGKGDQACFYLRLRSEPPA